jgi:hypothetical protein
MLPHRVMRFIDWMRLIDLPLPLPLPIIARHALLTLLLSPATFPSLLASSLASATALRVLPPRLPSGELIVVLNFANVVLITLHPGSPSSIRTLFRAAGRREREIRNPPPASTPPVFESMAVFF